MTDFTMPDGTVMNLERAAELINLGLARSMSAEAAAALRKPFPKSAIGKIPKGGIQLDYVGHAAVTDRLLAVDPEWTWEPMATTPEGLPMPDGHGNLWIRLTVCGVTRIGVGDGKSMKELIGDAIRNAAMRFGVALDLWSKEELESSGPDAASPKPGGFHEAPDVGPTINEPPETFEADPITDAQVKKLNILANDLGLDRDGKLAGIAATIGHEVTSSKDLSKDEATKVIKAMQEGVKRRQEAAK